MENRNFYNEILTRKQKKYLAVRSVIDRILAALALIVLSPLFLVVSVAQKISAPDEPIFFLQKRVGRGAHCFNIIKFRTMKSSAPKNVATGDLESPETYISRLGRFLRDTSIDELPQFLNILKGNMALIGPRPLVEKEVEVNYPDNKDLLLSLKPGLTGYWQAYARNNVGYENGQRQRMELYYIEHSNWGMDIRIIFQTAKVVLSGDGAQ